MPSAESVLFLMGSVAMQKEYKSYKHPVSGFREIEELKRKQQIITANRFKNVDNFLKASLKVTHIFKPLNNITFFYSFTHFLDPTKKIQKKKCPM